MMRLLPRSLFGRLVLVLLAGLMLAQLVSAYINMTERDQLLYRAGGMQMAQRMADIAKLLDSLPAAERKRIVAVFNAPPLSIALDRPPLGQGQAPSESDAPFSVFATVLRYALGEGMPVNVVVPEGIPEGFRRERRFGGQGMRMTPEGIPEGFRPERGFGGQGMRMMPHWDPGMHGLPRGGAFYIVQIGLHDGTLVTFDSYLSPQEAAVPWRLALTLLVLLGTVIVLSLIAVRWATGPLSALATAAENLGENINRAPLPETGPVEVQRAARAFNTMQQRLSRFIAERTRVLAAMSHDLKTPITRLRLRTEMLDDETLRAKYAKDLDEMEAMVAQTLDFMRDASAGEAAQQVDIMALIESLQADYQEMGDTVKIEGVIAHPYLGRPLALRRCLTNLIDNAVRYGRRATIMVEDAADRITIRIVDEGPGIPEEDLERAFEPFFRGEQSRNRETGGTGLGLGIARNIARAHGGDLQLKNRPGGGLEATLSLPLPRKALARDPGNL
ncbi:MAG: HAMP domain-containing protein [Betaproteobacteria bacterium]|nr:HAMP domain-containing protein [Betaproteobacteria bacterium]